MYKYTKVTLEEIQRSCSRLLGCKFAVLYAPQALFAGSNGVAYPSQKPASADLSGYNARNIRAAIKKLH